MVNRFEVRGKELGGDEFYSDWVEVVKYDDYAALKKQTDKLVRLRRGGTVTPEEMEEINKYVNGYQYD